MSYHSISYILLSASASLLAIIVAIFILSKRRTPGSREFALMLLAGALWAMSGAFDYGIQNVDAKILWSKISYFGVVSVGPLWLLFAMQYGRPATLPPRSLRISIWIIPFISLLLVLSNEVHGLVWHTLTPITIGTHKLLLYGHGIVVWIIAIYSYLFMLLGTIMLVRTVLRSMQLFRRQAAWLLFGISLPWMNNMLYLLGFSPWHGQDLTPIAFIFMGVAMSYAIYRDRLFDIVPIARESLIERMSDGVLVLDAENRFLDVNPAAAFMIGCDANDVVGRPAASAPPPWDELLPRFSDRSKTEIEVEIQTSWWVDVSMSSIHDRRGKITGRLFVLRDISKKKEAETKMLHYNAELEASNADLDAFAHSVAHDLRNPVSVVIGIADLLQECFDELPRETVLDQLDELIQAGHRMSGIIDSLLLLARIRGLEEIPAEALDMGTIVREAQERLSRLIQEVNAELIIAPEWPLARGNAAWIEHVWVNYISNALKYGGNPEQGIVPRVELGSDYSLLAEFGNTQARHIRFWVRDNGPGLTDEQRRRLFTPFTRLHQVQTKGHGLGLSIVRRIVTRLGGSVGVESATNRGSMFWFTLPADNLQDDRPEPLLTLKKPTG